jgi:hypothetical protein
MCVLVIAAGPLDHSLRIGQVGILTIRVIAAWHVSESLLSDLYFLDSEMAAKWLQKRMAQSKGDRNKMETGILIFYLACFLLIYGPK